MKNYQEQEKALWIKMKEELRKEGIKGFYEDGIVDFASWNEAKIKIIFLLKEPVNRDVNANKSLIPFVQAGAPKRTDRTWRNISRWVYSAFHAQEHFLYEEKVKSIGDTPNSRKEWLKYIAVVNLKKQPGGSTTNTQVLLEDFEKHYAKWLPKQLHIYDDADVIVCCGEGVKDCLIHVFNETFNEKYDKSNWKSYKYPGSYKAIIPYYKSEHIPLIIDYWHPAARSRNEKKNNVFKHIIKDLYLSESK